MTAKHRKGWLLQRPQKAPKRNEEPSRSEALNQIETASQGEASSKNEAPNQNIRKQDQDIGYLSERIDKLATSLEKSQLREYVDLMQHPRTIIFRNLLAGTARGVGLAVGFTIFAATIVYFLQMLGALNLPIIGDFIADIVRIVQQQLEINPR